MQKTIRNLLKNARQKFRRRPEFRLENGLFWAKLQAKVQAAPGVPPGERQNMRRRRSFCRSKARFWAKHAAKHAASPFIPPHTLESRLKSRHRPDKQPRFPRFWKSPQQKKRRRSYPAPLEKVIKQKLLNRVHHRLYILSDMRRCIFAVLGDDLYDRRTYDNAVSAPGHGSSLLRS